MSTLELVANLVTILSVWLAARNHKLTWPTGIISGVLYGVIFFQSRLYADVILQIFFVATSIKGWWDWKYGGTHKTELPLSRLSWKKLLASYLPFSLLIAVAHGGLLYYFTNASYPFLDSVILIFSVVGQFLLMHRKLENWLFWIIVDAIAAPLYASKGLYLTSAVYAAFFFNAIYGYWVWRKSWRQLVAAST